MGLYDATFVIAITRDSLRDMMYAPICEINMILGDWESFVCSDEKHIVGQTKK